MFKNYLNNNKNAERYQVPLSYLLVIVPFALFFLFSISLNAQSKQDYVWITGNNSTSDPGIEGFIYNFNNSDSLLEYFPVGFDFDFTNSSICDSLGNILFYTNGCEVANKEHSTMPNGYDINEGDFIDLWLDDCSRGFPSLQGAMIFPDPANKHGYYLITKYIAYDQIVAPFARDLQYSYIDMTLDGGLGDVTKKNEVFFSEIELPRSHLNGIKHASENKYWLVQPTNNHKLATFLIDSSGVNFSHNEEIESWIDLMDSGPGNSNFSSDGSKFAFSNNFQGLFLYDFDRETGKLSNFRHANITSEIGFAGVEFSPSSEFLYLSANDSLWQLDLNYPDLIEGAELIATWDGIWTPYPNSFGYAKLGPDCRIYITSGGSSDAWHFINKPDLKGQACDFRYKGNQFPYVSSRGNLPHQPKFRVDEEEKCNPDITNMFGEIVYYTKDLDLYPNPTNSNFTIKLPDPIAGYLIIIDLNGRIVWEIDFDTPIQEIEISTSNLNPAIYQVEFIPSTNPDRLIYSQKLVVVE